MNRIRHIRRLACVLAGLAGALLAFAVTAPAALAWPDPPPPPSWQLNCRPVPSWQIVGRYGVPGRVPVHTVVVGGMPGWHIALIAAVTALLAAVLAVLADRAWAERRHQMADPASAMIAAPPPRRPLTCHAAGPARADTPGGSVRSWLQT